MSFLIENILKDKSYNSSRRKEEETENKLSYSHQSNVGVLEFSLKNRFYYNSYLAQNELANYYSVSPPVLKQYLDHSINDLKHPYTDKYYNRINYMPYPSSIYFNNQMFNKTRKGGQIRFTSNQTEELEKHFNSHKYLSPEDRKQLAALLCLSDRQVKTWFQNRRAKWRKYNNITEDSKKEDYHIINNNNNDYLYLRR